MQRKRGADAEKGGPWLSTLVVRLPGNPGWQQQPTNEPTNPQHGCAVWLTTHRYVYPRAPYIYTKRPPLFPQAFEIQPRTRDPACLLACFCLPASQQQPSTQPSALYNFSKFTSIFLTPTIFSLYNIIFLVSIFICIYFDTENYLHSLSCTLGNYLFFFYFFKCIIIIILLSEKRIFQEYFLFSVPRILLYSRRSKNLLGEIFHFSSTRVSFEIN